MNGARSSSAASTAHLNRTVSCLAPVDMAYQNRNLIQGRGGSPPLPPRCAASRRPRGPAWHGPDGPARACIAPPQV